MNCIVAELFLGIYFFGVQPRRRNCGPIQTKIWHLLCPVLARFTKIVFRPKWFSRLLISCCNKSVIRRKETWFDDVECYLQVLLMEDGQRSHPGAHAQNPHTVCKVSRKELEPAPILHRPTVATNVGGWQRRRKSAPRKMKDALVNNSNITEF